MLSITKLFEFEAAHHLPNHPGLCKQFHGHSYKLEVEVSGIMNQSGMIIDFGDLKKIVNDCIIKKYDHTNLNDYFLPPTAEMMVDYFAKELIVSLQSTGVSLERVRLWETSSGYCEWKRRDS
jgi:6-pyruvoyltetrahydropterin/6-carboxytetrahydropterin synthase